MLAARVVRIDSKEARQAWAEFRAAEGWKSYRPLLTAPDENLKLGKSQTVATYGLALAQSTLSGHNTCSYSTASCRAGCVGGNGNGRFDSVVRARSTKVRFLLANPSAFCTLLADEIDAASAKHGGRIAVRLNTFSDLPWEVFAPWIFESGVHFYDYTKNWSRGSFVPANYHLTFSASERTSDAVIAEKVAAGHNVAVVFDVRRSGPLPNVWNGMRVVDGDKSDARSEDPRGVVVGLRAKGSISGPMVRAA